MMIKCAQAGRILRVLMLTIRGDSALPKSSAPAADATSYRSERKARSALDHFDGRLQAACRWQSFNDDQDSRPDPFATSHRNNLPFRQAAGGTCPSATHARVPAGAPRGVRGAPRHRLPCPPLSSSLPRTTCRPKSPCSCKALRAFKDRIRACLESWMLDCRARVLLSLVDAAESDDPVAWEITRKLTGDRVEMMRDLRTRCLQRDPPLQKIDLADVLLPHEQATNATFLGQRSKLFLLCFHESDMDFATRGKDEIQVGSSR